MIEFWIPSTPVAQGRPKASTIGDKVRMYDPKKSGEYKNWVRQCAVEYMTMTGKVMFPRDIPLCMRVEIFIVRPKSKPKRYAIPTTKPDNTNYAKGIEDALNSVCYHDDSQLSTTMQKKRYSENPGVRVFIWEDKI
jgi:Holliday junction resolvase RusA-like endonuclease